MVSWGRCDGRPVSSCFTWVPLMFFLLPLPSLLSENVYFLKWGGKELRRKWGGSRGWWGFPGGSDGKRLPAMRETRVQSLGREDPLEKAMAPHSSTLAWRNPWMEEPGGLQSVGSQRVGHYWADSLSLSEDGDSGVKGYLSQPSPPLSSESIFTSGSRRDGGYFWTVLYWNPVRTVRILNVYGTGYLGEGNFPQSNLWGWVENEAEAEPGESPWQNDSSSWSWKIYFYHLYSASSFILFPRWTPALSFVVLNSPSVSARAPPGSAQPGRPSCLRRGRTAWRATVSRSGLSGSLWPAACGPPASSVHGISRARVLEWVPCPPSGDQPDQRSSPVLPRWRQILHHWATGEARRVVGWP